MGAELERGLQTIELMSLHARGLTFTEIATALDTSKGPTHRLLAELVRLGYVRLDHAARYHLTLKAASSALQQLARIPIVELARPLLENLAVTSGELARLNLVDGPNLVRVANAQGRQNGLRYDPEHGGTVRLSCAASGYMLLSQFPDEVAIARLQQDGFPAAGEHGQAAPRSVAEALPILHAARIDGYTYLADIFEDGIATLAYPVRSVGREVYVGVLTVSGPSIRFTRDVSIDVLPTMSDVADQLSHIPSEELLGFAAPAIPSTVERNGHSPGSPELERLAEQRST